LPAFEPRRVRGVWFRHVPARKAALGRPPVPADGRWQRGDVVEGLYLAESDATAEDVPLVVGIG
jgi:hypothetical protein